MSPFREYKESYRRRLPSPTWAACFCPVEWVHCLPLRAAGLPQGVLCRGAQPRAGVMFTLAVAPINSLTLRVNVKTGELGSEEERRGGRTTLDLNH